MNHHELFTFCKPILQSSQFSDFCKLIIVKAVLPLIFILCVNFNQQVWINLGPLLYHFADSYGPDDDMSIELSLEDVKKVAYHYGFVMEVEKMIETTYTANMRAMMQNRYHAAFWTMRKNGSRAKAQKCC